MDLLRSARAHLAEGRAGEALAVVQAELDGGTRDLVSIKALGDFTKQIAKASGAELKRVAVLGGGTTEILEPAIRCAFAKAGFLCEVYHAPFNGFRQELLNPASGLYAFRPDVAVLALGWRELEAHIPGVEASEQVVAEAARAYVDGMAALWRAAADHGGFPIIQQLFDRPPQSLTGVAERRLPGSARSFIGRVNGALMEAAPGFVTWLDCDELAEQVGRVHWSESKHHHHGKLGFNPLFLPHYAHALSGVVRQVFAVPKKCLVLDLDNTLWGGVIGDDGVEGIEFGAGTARGEAFADLCRYIKQLKDRGIALAVVSKNDPKLAREAFEKRRDMPLKLDDFSCFHCSWQPKSDGIRAVAASLNLHPSSFVFLDDNPAECDLIRRELPEVTVIRMPEDVHSAIGLLDGMALFSADRIGASDLLRGQSYAAKRQMEEMRGSSASLADFLTSLEMTCEIGVAASVDLERIAQLEARTNQFNLTTRRYRLDQLATFAEGGAFVLQARLKDKFAEHGLVSSLVCIGEGRELVIDSWLMSCRVFERSLEHFIFNFVVRFAKERGFSSLRGLYLPTERNGVVAQLYETLGFAFNGEAWILDLAAAKPATTYVTAG